LFSLMHVLFCGRRSPVFTEAKQRQYWAKFLTRFGIAGLFHNWEEYGQSKTIGFITDYLTIFTPNLVGVG